MPDLGHVNERIVSFKHLLYSEGINRNINSGRWQSEDEHAIIAFDHAFVTLLGEGRTIVGRLWASRDGTTSGRSHYPMIAIVESEDLPLSEVLRPFLHQLNTLKQRCMDTTSGDVVVRIAQEVQAAIDGIAIQARKQKNVRRDGSGALARIAGEGHPAHGIRLSEPELDRLLWHIEREFPEYRKRRRSESTMLRRQRELRPHHLRVPRCAPDGIEALALWTDLVRELFVRDVPAWIIAPLDHGWVDLVFGRAETDELACFKLGLPKSPLTTEIPYTIDPAFRDRVQDMVAESREAGAK